MNRKSRVWDCTSWPASRAPIEEASSATNLPQTSRLEIHCFSRRTPSRYHSALSLALATPPPVAGSSVPLIIGGTVAGDGALSSISPWPDFEPDARCSRAFRTTRSRARRRLFLRFAARLPETSIALFCLRRSSADHALAVARLRDLRCGLRALLPSDLT
eukprot:CAMPEP_0184712636 /NCGR_PEP_ID=MMETSP0314-20130426/3151_1 /TAXON_ID=38298 /ORGANISM="Rhodella maculata, Strain CCMP 736" /LENGTH=159 /DNA_ID=CAMNT_0027175125 /DNA_START=1 /DNA_END=477 /DNA_ORIENTATION=-